MRRWLIIIGCCLIYWWPMMAVHELGHILGAFINNGTIDSVELRPWKLSHTDISGSNNRLMDLWLGPIVGAAIPLIIAALSKKLPISQLSKSIIVGWSAFCFLANGLYLVSAKDIAFTDTNEMIKEGQPYWQIFIVGALFIIVATVQIWCLDKRSQAVGPDETSPSL